MNKKYASNKKALFDYEIIKSYEAGMKLIGPQVKSIRDSTINLLGSYASIENGQVFLKQCYISKPDHSYNGNSFDENANIVLLLNKREIADIYKEVQNKGISLIPLEVYQREGTGSIKIKIAVAKGRKYYDKRESLKRKQADIDVKRQMKENQHI